MKIVWFMSAGYILRHYDGVIRVLAARGHEVVIAYQTLECQPHEMIRGERMVAELGNVSIVAVPESGNAGWLTLANRGRLMRDYLRYFEPAHAQATALRARAAGTLPRALAGLCRALGPVPLFRRALVRMLEALERAVPPDPSLTAFLATLRPDVVAVTPLVYFGSSQVDAVKAARALGIPSVLGVASWDNLTSKGLMRVVPDRVLVWNETQKREAVEFHGARAEQVIVTGAQIFDQWFDWRPPLSRAEFCAKVGFPDDRPYVLYMGSGSFVAPREAEFVEGWLRELRRFDDPTVAQAAVMVRPYPNSYRRWLGHDVESFAPAVVWPLSGATESDADYADDFAGSIYYSAVVVGVNTSAMIESGILRRPVCTLRDGVFAHSQEGTLHFEYLRSVGGGLIHEHHTVEEQFAFLGRALRGEPGLGDKGRRFIASFVRPHGIAEAVTPRVAAALEDCASLHAPPLEPASPTLRMMLSPLARIAALLKKARQRLRSPVHAWSSR